MYRQGIVCVKRKRVTCICVSMEMSFSPLTQYSKVMLSGSTHSTSRKDNSHTNTDKGEKQASQCWRLSVHVQ